MPSVIILSSGFCWKYCMEDVGYGGGKAGAAYDVQAPPNAQLSLCNIPYNEEQILPWEEYTQEQIEHAGQALLTRSVFSAGIEEIPGKHVQYVQNATWLNIAVTGTAGALPYHATLGSWVEHYFLGGLTTNEYSAYGCYLTKYVFTAKADAKGGYSKETIEFNPYLVKAETIASFAVGWHATAPSVFKDCTLKIGGQFCTTLEEVTLTITKKYTDSVSPGAYYNKYPHLEAWSVEVEASWREAYINETTAVNLMDDMLSATATLHELILTGISTATLTIADMKVKPKTLNINVVPEKGIKRYKCTFEIGGATTMVVT